MISSERVEDVAGSCQETNVGEVTFIAEMFLLALRQKWILRTLRLESMRFVNECPSSRSTDVLEAQSKADIA